MLAKAKGFNELCLTPIMLASTVLELYQTWGPTTFLDPVLLLWLLYIFVFVFIGVCPFLFESFSDKELNVIDFRSSNFIEH